MHNIKQINLLALVLFSCFFSTLKAQEEWKIFSENNYSIKYPVDWELNQSGQMNTSFILFSPIVDSDDIFRENINLLIQDLTGHNLNLDSYVELSVNQLTSLFEQGEIHENERLKSNSLDYQKIIYSGLQGETLLKFEMYCWVIKNKAYVLTLTCEATEFEAYRKTGEKILNSFNLKI